MKGTVVPGDVWTPAGLPTLLIAGYLSVSCKGFVSISPQLYPFPLLRSRRCYFILPFKWFSPRDVFSPIVRAHVEREILKKGNLWSTNRRFSPLQNGPLSINAGTIPIKLIPHIYILQLWSPDSKSHGWAATTEFLTNNSYK